MRKSLGTLAAFAAGALVLAAAVTPASAACTRLGFSVNDYGKDGPTRDAKQLLDKYVAKWAGEHGISKYTTGKKDVSCELFLNFILFDEHTCKAEATVCWDGPAVAGSKEAKSEAPQSTPSEAKPKAAKAEKVKTEGASEAAASEKTEKPAAKKEAAVKHAAKTKPIETGSTTKTEEPAKVEDPGDPDPASPNYGGKNPAQ